MTEPLTPERLAEIRELVFGVQHFTAPWQLLPEPTADGYWQVHYATDNPLAGLAVLVPDYGWDIARFVEESVTFVPELLAELDRVRAERDELKAITVNARQLSGHWSRQSSAALFGSQVEAMRTDPYGAGMRLGCANQASNCVNELRDVLDGETADTVTEKASTTTVPTATPEPADMSDPPYDVPDGQIKFVGGGPITLHGWHYTELAPDFYGHVYMQIGGWLPEGWPSEDTPAGTAQLTYAHLPGRSVPLDMNVEVSAKGYGTIRRFIKIQWRKFTSEPERGSARPVVTVIADEAALTARQERLLAEIRRNTDRTVWSTKPVGRIYRGWNVPTPDHEARRDLAALAKAGHLIDNGDDTGRRYRLNTRKDGA